MIYQRGLHPQPGRTRLRPDQLETEIGPRLAELIRVVSALPGND